MSTLGKLSKLDNSAVVSARFMALMPSVPVPYLWKAVILVAAQHFCNMAKLTAVSLAITVLEHRNEHLKLYSVIYFEIVRNYTKLFYFRYQTFFKFSSALN